MCPSSATYFALYALGPGEHALHLRRLLEQRGVERVCIARSEKRVREEGGRGDMTHFLTCFPTHYCSSQNWHVDAAREALRVKAIIICCQPRTRPRGPPTSRWVWRRNYVHRVLRSCSVMLPPHCVSTYYGGSRYNLAAESCRRGKATLNTDANKNVRSQRSPTGRQT